MRSALGAVADSRLFAALRDAQARGVVELGGQVLACPEALRAHGHRNVIAIDGETDLAAVVAPFLKSGGAVVGLGAGSISAWMHGLQKKLEALS